MTPEQIALVQDSFRKVPAEAAAELFYNRLFAVAPELRPMFPENLTEQGKKLMAMLAIAVNGLKDVERLLPAVRELGIRHAGYKVEPGHYETVGGAFLWTLEQGLGEDFTDEVRQAWTDVYSVLSATMIEAAYEAAA